MTSTAAASTTATVGVERFCGRQLSITHKEDDPTTVCSKYFKEIIEITFTNVFFIFQVALILIELVWLLTTPKYAQLPPLLRAKLTLQSLAVQLELLDLPLALNKRLAKVLIPCEDATMTTYKELLIDFLTNVLLYTVVFKWHALFSLCSFL